MKDVFAFRMADEDRREIRNASEEDGVDSSTLARGYVHDGLMRRRVDKSMEAYFKGKASMGKAARLAGISLYEFMDELARRKIPINYGLRELEEDIAAAKE